MSDTGVKFNLLSLFGKINSIKTKYKKIGNAKVHISEIKSGDNKGALLIMFPPTQDYTGWVKNFSAFVKVYNKSKKWFFVHTGFFDLWGSVEKYVVDEVEKYINSSIKEKIIIAGYSQGAALATIAHEKIYNSGLSSLVCTICFGSPRVFIGAPSGRFRNLHRVYVRGDIVTRIPWFPFSHVGKHHAIGERCFCGKIEKHMHSTYLKELDGLMFDESREKKEKAVY